MSELSNLVYVDNNQPVTTSELVAKFFEKEHYHVLRDIKELLEQLDDDRGKSNFGLTVEVKKQGALSRETPSYQITRDGFMLLCMGYTGKKALQIKLAYIDAFNKMNDLLVSQQHSLQAKFNEADYNYLLASEYASEAGKALNILGKKIKPACKSERDQLFNELQIALDFNSKEANND